MGTLRALLVSASLVALLPLMAEARGHRGCRGGGCSSGCGSGGCYMGGCCPGGGCGGAGWTAYYYTPADEASTRKETRKAHRHRGHCSAALEEVNELRATRGLPPFVEDEGLTEAAKDAAEYRARYGIEGHTGNDFAFVPAGTWARAAGCAAWEPEMGWGSCCSMENWTYAGAAYAMGPDGRRYMHLFVR